MTVLVFLCKFVYKMSISFYSLLKLCSKQLEQFPLYAFKTKKIKRLENLAINVEKYLLKVYNYGNNDGS